MVTTKLHQRNLANWARLPQRGRVVFQGPAVNAPVRIKALPRYASIADAVAAEKPGVPLYLLHPKRFRAVAERFAAFPGDALYAVKANPSPQALEHVWDAGMRHFDTASLGEIELIKSRFPDAQCHFMTPVRLPGAAKVAFEKYGVTDYVVDCDFELDKLLAETGGAKSLRIFVRIATPLGGAILELSSKFGTPPAEAAKLLKRVAKTGAIPAVTFHVGSQCLSPFSYAQAIEMARRTATLAKVELQALDMGGGFPGPYTGNDVPPYHWYFDTIKEALQTLPNPNIPLLCEPGRAMVAEGMSLVTQVVLRKGYQHLHERRHLWQFRRTHSAGLDRRLSGHRDAGRSGQRSPQPRRRDETVPGLRSHLRYAGCAAPAAASCLTI